MKRSGGVTVTGENVIRKVNQEDLGTNEKGLDESTTSFHV